MKIAVTAYTLLAMNLSVSTPTWPKCTATNLIQRGTYAHMGAVVQLVEYRTRNREVAVSTHTRSTANNLEQVVNLLCAQANSASYPQQDKK